MAWRLGEGKVRASFVVCARAYVYLLQINPAQKLDQGLAEHEKESETNEGPRQCADIVDDGLGISIKQIRPPPTVPARSGGFRAAHPHELTPTDRSF